MSIQERAARTDLFPFSAAAGEGACAGVGFFVIIDV